MNQKNMTQFILGLFFIGICFVFVSQINANRKDKYKVDPMKILKKIESERELHKLKKQRL